MTQATRGQLGPKRRKAAIVLLSFRAGWVNKPAGMRKEPFWAARPPYFESLICSSNLAHQHKYGIVELIHDPFFEGDDGVIGDVNLFGANLSTTLGDIAEP
jgi:hypothetical protein